MFDRDLNAPLNSVTYSQEPLASNSFFLSHLWILFSTHRLSSGIFLYGFASGFAFWLTFNVRVLGALPQIPYQISQELDYQVLFKIYNGVVSLLLRDKNVVELSQHILSQISACTWVFLWANLQARVCHFMKNYTFGDDLKRFF